MLILRTGHSGWSEYRVKALIPDDLSEEIKGAYENAHVR